MGQAAFDFVSGIVIGEAVDWVAGKMHLGKNIGGAENTHNDILDYRKTDSKYNDFGEEIMSTRDFKRFIAEMQAKGLDVKIDSKGKVLVGEHVAGFDPETGIIYVKKKPTKLCVLHEGYHAEQFSFLGKKEYRNMKANLTKKEAYNIANDYIEKYGLTKGKSQDFEKYVTYYEDFYKAEGTVWLVVVEYPSLFSGDVEETTYVISDLTKEVVYVMDTNGSLITKHLASDNEEDDEWDCLESDCYIE